MENKYETMKIDKHNFEILKNRLKKFSEQTKTDLEIDKVRTGGDLLDVCSKGIFGFFNHSVTGKELNELTSQIQEYLIDINKTQIKIIKEFKEVYNTFESLDKDYIDKICVSIKGIEKTNEKIESILKTQKLTIEELIKFKNKVENYKIDEDSEIKLEKLKKTVIISNIIYGIIILILFLLFFIGSK